jgi:hypothetical protein
MYSLRTYACVYNFDVLCLKYQEYKLEKYNN